MKSSKEYRKGVRTQGFLCLAHMTYSHLQFPASLPQHGDTASPPTSSTDPRYTPQRGLLAFCLLTLFTLNISAQHLRTQSRCSNLILNAENENEFSCSRLKMMKLAELVWWGSASHITFLMLPRARP